MQYYNVTPQRHIRVRLEKGEDVLEALASLCARERVVHADIQALGACEYARIGYYDLRAKSYAWQMYETLLEVVSFVGNIAFVDGKPFVHAHAVLSDTQNKTVGGHVFEMRVGVTLEVLLCAYSEPLTRCTDDTIGLKLLSCSL